MLDQFLQRPSLIKLGIALLIGIVMYFLTKNFNRDKIGQSKEIQADFFRIPANNVLLVIGLLTPVLVALVSHLFSQDPNADYSYIISAIAILFVVLVLSVWEVFALISKATDKGTIQVNWPADFDLVFVFGLMCAYLILALIYIVLFFLLEIRPSPPLAIEPRVWNGSTVVLSRPAPSLQDTRHSVVEALGAPASQSGNAIGFEGPASTMWLCFDASDRVDVIVHLKKESEADDGSRFCN